MSNLFVRTYQPWRTFMGRLEKPITGLFVTLGLATASFPYMPANSAEVPTRPATVSDLLPAANHELADGVYLYGQAPERDQIDSAYMVFEVTQGQLVGAFYMPRSSFDCFYGSVKGNELALTVIDSYERSLHPYAVALQPTDTLASTANEAVPLGIEGFHKIDGINANDQRLLSTCQNDVSHQSL